MTTLTFVKLMACVFEDGPTQETHNSGAGTIATLPLLRPASSIHMQERQCSPVLINQCPNEGIT